MDRHFFATCPSGLEGVLGAELKSLGCRHVRPLQGGVSFEGPDVDAYRACLWSRTASRVLRVVARVGSQSADAFYDGAMKVDWPALFHAGRTIAVYAKGTNAALRNTQFTALKLKDAVCDSFRHAGMERPSVDADDPDVRLQVTVHGRKATIYADYAGDSLHRRGYRNASAGKSHEAPLKEALAAGMLLWAGWGNKDKHQRQLYDPVCGSGTLVIEAAMMATDMAPGLLRRKWGFEGLADFDEDAWASLVSQADDRFERGLEGAPVLLGSDIDPDAVGIARSSAKAMGLGGVTAFVQADCSQMAETLGEAGYDIGEEGLVAMNPPYGVRLLEGGMDAFYRRLAEGVGALPSTWEMVAITPDALFDAKLGMDALRVQQTYNGPIEATIRLYRLGFSAFRDLDVVSITGRESKVRVSSAHPEQFAARLRKSAKQARKWSRREGVGAYRVYDRDLPDFSLSIDEYIDRRTGEAHLMVAEYKAPGEIDPGKAARRFDDAVAIAAAVLEAPEGAVHTRTRRQDVGGSQYAKAGRKAQGQKGPRSQGARNEAAQGQDVCLLEVEEAGHVFEVHMEGALDTGLFLDHRPVRSIVQAEAKGRRFLNLFAYTGSVSVYAAAGGALETTTVDMNKGYLDWARRNMSANGFDGPSHRCVRSDVLEWLDGAKGEYDLIFVDPPTFSNSKSMGDRSWDIQRDHVWMLSKARRLLAPGGTILFSGNLRSFKLDEEAVAALGLSIRNITPETIPEDFARNQKVHFCYRLEAL